MEFDKASKILTFRKSQCQTNPFEFLVIENTTLEQIKKTDRELELEFFVPVLPEFTRYTGELHKGAATTIVDELTAITVLTADPNTRNLTSIELSVSFSSAAYMGEMLVVKTSCSKVGNKIGFCRAEIWSGEKLIGNGTHSLYMLPETIKYE